MISTNHSSRNSRNSNSCNQDDKMTNLMSLPDEVTTHICKFLDVSALMNLRLTCVQLKSVVEQAAVLENLPIKIVTSKQLQRVLESRVPFNNITLGFRSLEEQTYLPEFWNRFGPWIKKLNIKTYTSDSGHAIALQLLGKCTQLKELEIRTVHAVTYKQRAKCFEKMLINLRGLRKLTIHRVEKAENGQEEIGIFLTILNNCMHLEEFKIPAIESYNLKLERRRHQRLFANEENEAHHINIDPDGENWEQDFIQDNYDPFPDWNDSDSQDILISPILNYIRLKADRKFAQVKRINIGEISNFEKTTFKDLLHVCYENDIRLLDVAGTQLVDFINDTTVFTGKYGGVIHSINFCSFHEFPYVVLENLKDLTLLVSPGFGKVFAESRENSDLILPHLKNLRLQFICSEKSRQVQHLIKQVFRAYFRPTVETLQLEMSRNDLESQTVGTRDLVNNFRNLRELDLRTWDARDSEFCLLWTNLSELEKITIIHCKNLTNKAFVGDYNLKDDKNIDQRPLNRLKKLKSLTIHDVNGQTNEIAMMGSFRWIKLQCFEFHSTVLSEIRKDVFRAMMLAPLGRHVEYFNVPNPCSQTNYFERRALVQGFKNLKQRIQW